MMASDSKEPDAATEKYKRKFLPTLHGNVLEIGPGTGPNLQYYSRAVRWFGIEPNIAMTAYLWQEAQRLGFAANLCEGTAEKLPAADNSMDAVVSTLVLCSVRQPGQAIQEILRVLKPGGQFVFIEHVAAPRGTFRRSMQSFVRPVWSFAADGCQPNRETWTLVEGAGFSHVELEHFHLDVPIVGPHIAGVAIK